MKMDTKKLTNKLFLASFLALGTLAVTSCNKDKNQNGQEVPEGKSQLVVRIAGITDGNEEISTKASLTGSNASRSSLKLTEGNSFDVISGIDNEVPNISSSQSIAQPNLRASTGKHAAAMADGIRYKLFFYKKDGATYTYVKSAEFQALHETPVALEQGTYKWVALSYNTTESVPDRSGADQVVLTQDNRDVIYANSGATDLVIGSSQSTLNITFQRIFSRIAIEVNTLGMFGPMTGTPTISATGGKAKTGTVNLSNGTVTNLTAGTNISFTAANFTNIDLTGTTLPAGDSYRKVAYFYTAPEATAQSLNLTLSGLQIKTDVKGTRNFGTTQLNQSNTIVPTAGTSKRFLVGVAESPLTYGTVKWARSNLYYRTGGALNTTPYRFYHTNPYNPDVNESFFAFKGHLPRTFANSVAAQQKDPCALVYPAGLWKTPTSADLNTVTSNTGLLDNLLTNILGGIIAPAGTSNATYGSNYIEYTTSSGVQSSVYPAETQKLRFYYNGTGAAVSAVTGLVQLNLGEVGETATFWSSDQLLSTELIGLNLAGVGAWGYMGNTAPAGGVLPPRPERALASKAAGVLNLNVAGLGVIQSKFMNVRCVRNTNWNGSAAGYDPMPAL